MTTSLIAQNPSTQQQPPRTQSAPRTGNTKQLRDLQRYEIHAVEFEGNIDFPDAELFDVIISRPSEFSLSTIVLRSLRDGLNKSEYSPAFLTQTVDSLLRPTINEARFFDRTMAENDVLALRRYFDKQGFHDIRVRYNFHVSSDTKNNVLRFIISLGTRYKLDTLVIKGLEKLTPEVTAQILSNNTITQDAQYSQTLVEQNINMILVTLRNSGYPFASFQRELDTTLGIRGDTNARYTDKVPTVFVDTVRKTDSITVFMSTGKRHKIGSITFYDSTFNQPIVTDKKKLEQLDFSVGDWYNQTAIGRSEQALNALGTFERSTSFTKAKNDSTIDIYFNPNYLRAQELTTALLLHRLTADNFLNAGVELGYLHRNIFNAAQNLTISGSFILQDIERYQLLNFLQPRLLNDGSDELAFQLQGNLTYAHPDIFRISSYRVNLAVQALYSQRQIVTPFTLRSFTPRVTLSARPGLWSASADFSVDIQQPLNYATAQREAIERIKITNPNVDTNDIKEQLALYSLLAQRTNEQFAPIAANVTLNFFNDQRNDPFYPSSGHFFLGSFDIALPIPGFIANYSRLQFTYNRFSRTNDNAVFAVKGRIGKIFWANNSYVPIERHFFVGGPNSIRSYPSRSLRDMTSGGSSSNDVLSSLIGVAEFYELTAEYRYTFPYYESLGDWFASQVHALGITVFTDIGNGFNRLSEQTYGKAQLLDYLNPAISYGLGIRRDTPVGPIRIDFGLRFYDPTDKDPAHRWFYQRGFFEGMSIQLGLGHTF